LSTFPEVFLCYIDVWFLTEPSVNALLADNSIALLADNSIALLAGTLAQIEKQLKLISLTLSLSQISDIKQEIIHTYHKRKCTTERVK
jgi:hypothetical protein